MTDTEIVDEILILVKKNGGNMKMPIPFKYSRGTLELVNISANNRVSYIYTKSDIDRSTASLNGVVVYYQIF